MADAEIAVVLRLIASQFQSELKKSGSAVGEFGKFISDWRVQATAVAGALVALTKSTADYGEELAKTSQKTGVATTQLQGYLYAARLADVSTEQFTQALTYLNKAIAEDAQSLRGAGITGKDLNSVMLQLNDLFQRLPDGPRKTALAMELMGRSGASVIPVFNQNLKETQAEFDRLGVTMSQEAIAASQKFNDEMKRLEIRMEGLRNQLGLGVIPGLTKLVEWAGKAAEAVAKIPGIPGVNPLIAGAAALFHEATRDRVPGEENLVTMRPPPAGLEPIIPSSGKEALGPGNEKGVAEYYKYVKEQQELFITGSTALYEEEKTRIEERMALERKADADRESYLKKSIDEYKQWGAAAEAAVAKFNEQEERQIKAQEEANIAWVTGKERLANLGFYDSLNEGLQRYVRENEQTFNLATDTVRQAASSMSQGMKTFFLDVLKGQVKDVKDLFAGLLNFTQNIVADIAARLVSAGITTGLASSFNTGPNLGAKLAAARGSANPNLYGPGYQEGGAFVVPGTGGPDSRAVGFRVTPGERVTIETPEQQRARGGGGVTINVINQTSAKVQPSSRTGPGGESIVDIVVKQVDQALAGGAFDRSLSTSFGIRRTGFAR